MLVKVLKDFKDLKPRPVGAKKEPSPGRVP